MIGSPTVKPTSRLVRSFAILLLAALPARTLTAAEPIPQTEQSDVATLPAADARRVLVMDAVFTHSKDGRVYIVDTATGRMQGMIPAADYANLVMDPHGARAYIAETIWTRGNRGTRQDLLSIYDTHTLNLLKEIDLPGRALITTKKQDADISADGRIVYVYNLTPSNSVIVVDTQALKVTGSIDTPGCGLIFAWGNHGFSSICADGSLTHVDLADPAHPAITHTPSFFSPDADPIFEQSPTDRATGRTFFISYTGLVYPTTLGPNAKPEAPWSINEAAGQTRAPGASAPFAKAWRPGGWQIADMHRSNGHMYVLMHYGTFWTHKEDGTEVWELDTANHTLVRRIPLPEPSNLVGITQDPWPALMSATDNGGFLILDPVTGQELRRVDKLGDTLLFTTATGQ